MRIALLIDIISPKNLVKAFSKNFLENIWCEIPIIPQIKGDSGLNGRTAGAETPPNPLFKLIFRFFQFVNEFRT